MNKFVYKYRKNIKFKKKVNLIFSISLNILLCIGKMVMAIFFGVFFFVSSLVNLSVGFAKLECYLGLTKENRDFKVRNLIISLLMLFAAIQYIGFMLRLVIWDKSVMHYTMLVGCLIALVSFIELGLVIKEFISSTSTGTYYRDIKLINLFSSLSAMVLTTLAITSFASETDDRLICGWMGVGVGIVMIIIVVFMIIVPYFSIVDNPEICFKVVSDNHDIPSKVLLSKSYFYGDRYAECNKHEDTYKVTFKREKPRLFKVHGLIASLLIVLSEILIFPYLVGAFIRYIDTLTYHRRALAIYSSYGLQKITPHI